MTDSAPMATDVAATPAHDAAFAARPPRFLPRAALDHLIAALRADGRTVIGPTVADGSIVLDEIARADALPEGWTAEAAPGRYRLRRRGGRVFDQAVGPMSWKRWLFPARLASDTEARPLAFVGVRACEIAAIRIHDRVLLEGPVADGDYRRRREASLIVAVECATALDTCFCTSMGTGPEVTGGYDVALTELEDGFLVRTATDAGAALVDGLKLAPATADQRVRAVEVVRATRDAIGDPVPQEGLHDRLLAAAESPRWAEIAERCLSCTNCTLVCPTCFCTGFVQRSDLDGGHPTAERTWDSCFTLEFARVAGGNFRPRTRDRYRQWLTHKFGTWWDQFGSTGCVGCGRCIAWCPVGIDVREELARVAPPLAQTVPIAVAAGPATAVAPDVMPIPGDGDGHAAPAIAPAAAAAPKLAADGGFVDARVMSTRRETADTVTLRFEVDDPALLAGLPGQFVMVSLPAFACPPISISRYHRDGLELTIRAAGPATAALTRLERGAVVRMRGPVGRGWPVEAGYGRDVVVVTGGIGLAPLRPLIDALLAERERFGMIRIAYGARTPGDRLYVDELDELAGRPDLDVQVSVDRAGPEWLGRVGVVTQLIDQSACSGREATAYVCGPERMMEATADVLGDCGISPDRIFLTLERHMECGVGLCGHCQLGKFFVCKDGPVFSLAELGSSFRREGL